MPASTRCQVQIGHLVFRSKAAAMAHFAGILNSTPLGQRVAPEHHADLLVLLGRHPDASEKIGVGVDHFIVDKAKRGTVAFYVVRTDGTKIAVSIFTAVHGREKQR